jgi:uncharacterized Fe-S cluster-containing protein
MNMKKINEILESLPGLDCGLCGSPTCMEFAERLVSHPDERERCVHLARPAGSSPALHDTGHCGSCAAAGTVCPKEPWKDSLGRDFDFILDTFPDEPGPRETIIPRNPMLTRELEIAKGDILIGRPLGMSCGCPVTHCGVVMEVDPRTGVIVWCVTGPLGPRRNTYKDLGFYSAEAYEGLVRSARTELKIGMRYFFMPHKCMLQWRHSGLINFIQKSKEYLSIRIEGLWIG